MGRKTEREIPNVLKDNNTITLHPFMVSELHLSGNELILFAIIYGFSKDGKSCFFGSNKYLSSWCQIHEGAVGYHIRKLIDKGLILKGTVTTNGETHRSYWVNFDAVERLSKRDASDEAQNFDPQKFDGETSKICGSNVKNLTDERQKFDTYREDESRRELEENGKGRKRPTRFRKPTLEEVTAYCNERNNGIDPQYFIDYNEARGWLLKGNRPMKDWKAAVRTWERIEGRFSQPKPTQRKVDLSDYGQPRPGEQRVNVSTGITEVYQFDGTWKVMETSNGEDYDDIDF